ncbi:prepilin-type N-terminal cleavage/methylation domain-containing protein [Ancylobacter sp. 6x-1]|uniref:Prepilin-type N-terminal cleavage/methylation domain-containing protein n=1 Tax=Ancylobacter crimeensis TaxID=2579147 RepID=A0ABT0DBN0_9HYPH|nr:prepilin-type N-terminal cleavage/methylation domain-containing protein [Ancylobacter crimeensis]MCK0197382.1 prepilin-type N-terminal cleavage/methylation domain-containing protein [Ancylobacter crimeensis]
MPSSHCKGFSLVELSIVLVILGLLTGGILAGQSLIRAAELRSVATEYQRWISAINGFRDKYMAIPGDMANATRFWQRMRNTTDCVTNSSATVVDTGVCDGTGDGMIAWDNSATGATHVNEMHQFWRQLAAAGFIDGNYTGFAINNSASVVPGTNSPSSKLTHAGWGAGGKYNCGSNGSQCFYGTTASVYRNYLAFGAYTGGNIPNTAVLLPDEAWNIDVKLDDGKPGTGFIIPQWRAANQCTTSSSNTDYTGTYNMSSSTVYCSFLFVNPF